MLSCVRSNKLRPNLVTYLDQTPKFKWWVIRCTSKNGHQKDMCFKEIGPTFANHSRLNNQHNVFLGGDLCGRLMGSLSVDFGDSLQFEISSNTFQECSGLLQIHLRMHSNSNLINHTIVVNL